MLVLDAGDYSMGTAFGAATRETGCELQLMSLMGYDVTTLGNHDFDFGPDGLAQSINAAAKAGRVPAIVASNTNLGAVCERLTDLRRIVKKGIIRRHLVIERGGIRFGVFGLVGKEASAYTIDPGNVIFTDPIETASEMVKHLREWEKVDIIICLSHGGVLAGRDQTFTEGEDIQLATAVPGIDVVIGGHSHTRLDQPVVINGRTPVVQAGKNAENLGELMVGLGVDGPKSMSYKLHAVDNSVSADRALAAEIDRFKVIASRVVFASRGYSIDQPLAVVAGDMPSPCAGASMGDLVADAIRTATSADVGLSATGMLRSGLIRETPGILTVGDAFALAPLGSGIVDSTPGNALTTAYFTAGELKNLLEFFLVANSARPSEYFPLTSGMKFHYSPSRPRFDKVTRIELGDAGRGYRLLDTSSNDKVLYSVGCSSSVSLILAGVPRTTKGRLQLVPKNRHGQPLQSLAEALVIPRKKASPYPPPPRGTVDKSSIATIQRGSGLQEIKEWQAIMDYMRSLPRSNKGELPILGVGENATEIRAVDEDCRNSADALQSTEQRSAE